MGENESVLILDDTHIYENVVQCLFPLRVGWFEAEKYILYKFITLFFIFMLFFQGKAHNAIFRSSVLGSILFFKLRLIEQKAY
jgi:hypothetical protein